ncbi:hypothetical protein FQV39_10920 [Bosea sp. F3-2]|uniref:hypothetical protein n=1 Tax=Bosea sp. F3-2 TaxID=2599640 RepID=UPI0011EE6AE8|nr:hypothetical protein [Bosea sp. F3-2]QEL23021.1 hypothetical protein FQV39_10920 [Bosea sp. F3-2]
MRIIWGISFVAACLSGPAFAQQGSAYSAGLRVAQARGYENADCYARVFAKHAVVVEKPNGRRGWYAASTPAYNAEQRSRCGIDRLQDLAVRQMARGSGRASGTGHSPAIAQRIGLALAARHGYSGSNAACFARTYATYASPQPSQNGRIMYGVSGASEHVFAQELTRSCRLTY